MPPSLLGTKGLLKFLVVFDRLKGLEWFLKGFIFNVFMRVKQVNEDFCVNELPMEVDFGRRNYALFLMKKNGWNTLDVVKNIAKFLRKNRKEIGFAGNKDKNAVTQQWISIKCGNKDVIKKIKELDMEGVELKFLGYSNKRINLGDLEGNHFRIVVRDLNEKKEFVEEKIKNFFGIQRFGVEGKNVEIGRCIVKRDFKKVCELLNLNVVNNDFIGVLRKVDLRLLKLFVGAYQAWMWNKVVEEIKEGDVERDVVEVVGFLTEFNDVVIRKKYEKIFDDEGISLDDFLINEFKKLSSEGGERKVFLNLKNFRYYWERDELNNGKLKCVLEFDLNKGCYATVVVDTFFNYEKVYK